MLRFAILVFSILLLGTFANATDLDSISFQVRIDDKLNLLHVTEHYYLPESEVMPNWHRVVFHKGIPGQSLLYQRMENAKLIDASGKEYELEQYGYGRERTHLNYAGNGIKGECSLSYDILFYFGDSDEFNLSFSFYDFPLATKSIGIQLETPAGISITKSNWTAVYSNGTKDGEFAFVEDVAMSSDGPTSYRLNLEPEEGLSSFFEPTFDGELKLSQILQLEPPTTYKEEWQIQGGFVLWILLGGVLLALVLRFMPVVIYPAVIRLYGIALFFIMLITGFPLYAFFWKATGMSDNFVLELIGQMIFWAVFVLMGLSVHKNLAKLNAKSYYSVLAFPILLLFLLGSASVSPTMYLLLPLGFAPLIFWFQSKNSNYLGATYYRLIEQVETAGKLTFEELVQKSGLKLNRLQEIIKNIPHHPILIDYEAKEFLSVAAVALQQKHLLCTNCGAATEVVNEDLLECNHCNTSYRESQEKKSSKPVPELVEVTVFIVKNIAYLLFIIWALVILAMVTEFVFDGFDDFVLDMGVIAVAGVIFGGLGFKLLGAAKDLKSGKNSMGKWALAPLFMWITPAFILYKFATSKRIQLHFDNNAANDVENFLKIEGTVSMQDFAKKLGINSKEALEMADYLCGNNLVEAVYDIEKNRIVHRSVWENLLGANSCKSCGGLVQIKDDKTVCMHCGVEG